MIIEECGTGGTSLGRFTRRTDRAWVEIGSAGRVAVLVSVATHEPLAEIDLAYMTVHDAHDGAYMGRGGDWQGALKIALGPHAYGCTWYQVKGKSRRYSPAA